MAESIDIRELNERIERQSAFVTNLTTGMDQIIVGQKHLVESLLIGLLSDGHVLLEGVPEEVDIEKLRNDLLALQGVESIHQLKVWAISSKNIHLMVHLFAPCVDRKQLHRAAIEMLAHEHGIAEVTLQIEDDVEMNCEHTHQYAENESHDHPHQH